jgi:hypothetical protein
MSTPLPPPAPSPRPIFLREPVRVVSAFATFSAAINAVFLGTGLYSGAVAAAITGILGAGIAFAHELFTRAEVVPLRPLEDYAAAVKAGP